MGLDRVWFMWRLHTLPTLPISTVKHINSTNLQLYTAKTEKSDSLSLRLLCVRNGILRRTCGTDAETVCWHVDVERLK